MKKKIFTGAAVAIVTPFKGKNNEEVDYDALGALIEYQIENGTDAIVICGTTGEASTMPDTEHLAVIEYAVQKTAGRIPVIAGTGSNDTKHAIALSQKAEQLGADALLSVTPYYNKTTQDGLYEHFKVIAESVSVPIILYNVPGRTNLNIEPATFERLCKIPNINAVKECNLLQIPETVKRCGDEFILRRRWICAFLNECWWTWCYISCFQYCSTLHERYGESISERRYRKILENAGGLSGPRESAVL